MNTIFVQRIWWLHPAWLFALIIGSTMALAISQSHQNYLLYDTPKYLNMYYGLLALGSIVAFAIGSQFAIVSGRLPEPVGKESHSWLTLCCYGMSGLALFGYLVWFAVAIKNGFSLGLLREVLLGDDPHIAFVLSKEVFVNIPGVTTTTQFAIAAVPLGVWLFSQGNRYIIIPVAVLVVIGLARALTLNERIAFIELMVPAFIIVIRQFVLNRPLPWIVAPGLRLAPFLGVFFLIFFFGCAEYFRSWKHYQKDFDSIVDFTMWRLSGYYTTAHNNGAMALETGVDNRLPFYTFQSLWSFPGIAQLPVGFEKLTGVDALVRKDYMLERFGTVELNNEGGLFTPAVDFGVLGFLIFWFVGGFLSGRLYRSFMIGSIAGLLFYPVFFLAILETPRFLYLSNMRSFPAIIAIIAVIGSVHYMSRMAMWKRLQVNQDIAQTVKSPYQ
jgi:oligosaccharide repeat unit polymerase